MGVLANVEPEHIDGTTVVAVRGEVDLSNGDAIQSTVLDAITPRTRRLLLDLTDVVYFDSVGVRLAFEIDQRLGRQDVAFCIARRRDSPVHKVLDLCGAEALLRTFDDRAAALDAP